MFLNPRRPKRKPTSEEQEEFLIEYDPVLPHDPKRVLSHNYKVICVFLPFSSHSQLNQLGNQRPENTDLTIPSRIHDAHLRLRSRHVPDSPGTFGYIRRSERDVQQDATRVYRPGSSGCHFDHEADGEEETIEGEMVSVNVYYDTVVYTLK